MLHRFSGLRAARPFCPKLLGLGTTLSLGSTLFLGTAFAAHTHVRNAVVYVAPVAYVYVTSNYMYPNSGNRVVGYAVDTNGVLTQVPGSPYPNSNVKSMAVNGKYLFAAGNNPGDHISTYWMNGAGSLSLAQTTGVIDPYETQGLTSWGNLVLDHSGSTLYPFTYAMDGNDGDDGYESLNIDKANGGLQYLSQTQTFQNYFYSLTFTANNVYAYAAGCDFDMRELNGYQRQSDGSLVDLSVNTPYPQAPINGYFCPTFTQADPTNHLAVDMQLTSQPGSPGLGYTAPDQIASYTIDLSNGNLMTTQTYQDMPQTAVMNVKAMSMAPSGKLLAVGGTKGLQIFNFNGGASATVNTGLLTTDEIDGAYWDNSNHLYAIGTKAGKLYIFTVTPTSAVQAPGSPHTITQPQTLIVQPK